MRGTNVKVDEDYFKESQIGRYELDESFDKIMEEENKEQENKNETQDALISTSETLRYVLRSHSKDQIIRKKNRGFATRSKVAEEQVLLYLLSETEPKLVEEACNDQSWMKAIREELD